MSRPATSRRPPCTSSLTRGVVVAKRRAGLGLGVPVVGTAVDGLARTLGGGRGVLVPRGPPRPGRGAVTRPGRRAPDPALGRACARQFTPSAAAAIYASAFWCWSWSCGLQS